MTRLQEENRRLKVSVRQLEENTEELNRALMETRDELLAARLNVRTTTFNCGATESNVCVVVIHYLPDVDIICGNK